MNKTAKFNVFADHHQFYLMDADIAPPIPEEVIEQDMSQRLRTAAHIVVFHTESASQLPVEIAFVPEPIEAEGVWAHRAEFSLSLPSGTAVLCGCTDFVPTCPQLSVTPSDYDGRAHFSGSGGGNEHYLIMLWPSTAQPITPNELAPKAHVR